MWVVKELQAGALLQKNLQGWSPLVVGNWTMWSTRRGGGAPSMEAPNHHLGKVLGAPEKF